MTPDAFRSIALSLPEAVEGGHMGHPDFRVGGRIFATLGYPDASCGVVKLSPDDQAVVVAAAPAVFAPVAGAWGRAGHTQVRLAAADEAAVRSALRLAWRARAPKRLLGREGPA